MWAILLDTYGHYYLQNPPIVLNPDGSWHAKNLHLGHDIVEIVFVKVNRNGNEDFLRKVKDQDWGAFDTLPTGTEILTNIRVDVH